MTRETMEQLRVTAQLAKEDVTAIGLAPLQEAAWEALTAAGQLVHPPDGTDPEEAELAEAAEFARFATDILDSLVAGWRERRAEQEAARRREEENRVLRGGR